MSYNECIGLFTKGVIDMKCKICGKQMKKGYVKASAFQGKTLFPPTVTLEFNVGYVEIEKQIIEKHYGWYCKDCGKFVLAFDVAKNVEIENPLDDFWEEDATHSVKVCPQCGEMLEQELPQCPYCRYHFNGMFPFI